MRPLLLLSLIISVAPLGAFSQTVRLSGLIFADYEYALASANSADEGENGFGYRRVYLTADAKLSDKFSTRVRFEANDGSTTSEGNPAPFIKDLSLKWSDVFGKGHSLEFGVTSPPSFTVAERAWGYRSLEKTILDRNGIVSSRDMGIVARGPVTESGSVKYGIMLANNSGVRAETDKNKRVYGQLEFYPGDIVMATIGSDFATYSDGRDQTLNNNVFVGAKSGGVTAGIEAYRSSTSFDNGPGNIVELGVALFARTSVSENMEAVVRVDRANNDFTDQTESYFIAGLSIQPDPHVRFIPNIFLTKVGDADSSVSARITIHANF